MALDRWIALIFVAFCCAYGYVAFFAMDGALRPFELRNPIWPSTFPKILSVIGLVLGMFVLLGFEKSEESQPGATDIDYRRLTDYNLGQAIGLLVLMVVYAHTLRPMGFLLTTTLFLVTGSALLGERRWLLMIVVAALATGFVWYLVQQVLGIFLRPLPFFMGN
ncbi:MAG: tripartite tricarboxylate transporter TctB family protein [Pseudomonadota bacterium]